MIHNETNTVTKQNGPRPAGPPDRCFYCKRKIGDQHADDCVLRKRTIILAVTIEVLQEVPQDYTEENIHRYFNEGTWCVNNSIPMIEKAMEQPCKCLCDLAEVKYLREATAEDEKRHDYENADD